MQPHVAVAHLAIQFGLGNQRRHRIDHHHIYGSGGGQRRGDFERLLAVVRLRHQQVINVHTQFAGIGRVERVLGVDEGGHPAGLLRLGDQMQGQGSLAGRLRPEDLHHASAREAAHAQRGIERNRAAGDHRHRHHRAGSQAQNGAFTELLIQL